MYTPSFVLTVLAVAGTSLANSILAQRPLQPHLTQEHILQQDTTEDNTSEISSPTLPSTPLLDLHRNLVQIPSTTGNEADIGHYLVSYLKSLNLTVETQEVPLKPSSSDDDDATSSKHKPRFNIHAYPPGHRQTRALFTSHIDTVPPFINYTLSQPSSSLHKTNTNTTSTSTSSTSTHHNTTATLQIHGRGTNDDKSSIAAQITALHNLLTTHRIHPSDASILLVVGEETGGDGMLAANSLSLHPSIVIFGEPTESKLVSGHKGLLQFDIHVRGVAAHSGYPWLGLSANEVLVKALAAVDALQFLEEREGGLPRSRKYGRTTVNLGLVRGGVASNVVAESALAKVAVRLAGGTVEGAKAVIVEAVERATHELLKGGKGALEVVWTAEGYPPVDIDADVEGFERMTVNYGTDVPNFRGPKGMKRYLYGPGSILVAHGPKEYVTVGDLEKAVGDYERIVLSALDKL